MRQIVEAGLRDMSNQLVYQECLRLERTDLIEFCREKVLNQKPQMKILSRSKSTEVNESDEQLKREIKQLRNVCKVIRTGNVAMDILAEGEPVSWSRFSRSLTTFSVLWSCAIHSWSADKRTDWSNCQGNFSVFSVFSLIF